MLKELRIPRMGSVENARLIAWHIEEGASFSSGDVLYELETDKTTTEVEAPEPGVLASKTADEGQDFKVGDQIGWWAAPGTAPASIREAVAALGGGLADVSDDADASQNVAPIAVSATASAPDNKFPVSDVTARPISIKEAQGARISPLARRLAAQHRVDVSQIAGSGAYGKINAGDIMKAASTSSNAAPQPVSPPAAAPAAPVSCVPAPAASAASLAPDTAGAKRVPHSMRRLTIARRMTAGAAVPTLTADMNVELTALRAWRARTEGKGVSVLAIIAHALVATLREFPQFNAHWHDDAALMFDGVHLGVAVDTPDGLVVPVIRDAQNLSPLGITDAIRSLAERARSGTLSAAEMTGSSFTLSNPGSVGPVHNTSAILNVPEVGLLGLSGIRHEVVPVRDANGWATAVREFIRPSLTFDHRANDGGPVVAFLASLKNRIESL